MNKTLLQGDGSRDFDFLMGKWVVRHRRLKERLNGSTEWVEFDGITVADKLLDGQVNVDDNVLNFPQEIYRAISLRCYDPQKQLWSIWWLDSRTPNRLDPPVVGKFVDGVGTFYAEDTLACQPIRVRFQWMNTQSPSPCWEQAFSADNGTTWEINWIMDFSRMGT
ncbi:MAG: DUF1579 domain-containing protein [Chloroflexi bacterium HGW-Chloroflexi-10]|nr:MAG: DUF1579 domain-containing protein [Chloroflexi bacterium HGW-Chloroflexi-10]